MDSVTLSGYGAKALEAQCNRVRTAQTGEQHKTIASAAASCGRIPEEHLPYQVAFGELMDAALDTGEEFRKARQTVRDGLRFGRRRIKGIPEWKESQPTSKSEPYRLPQGLRDALERRTEFPLELETAWELASVSEIQAQSDLVQSWDYLADRIEIPLVVGLSRLIREVGNELYPNTDAPVFALRLKIEASASMGGPRDA
jgi:hypothetical protein